MNPFRKARRFIERGKQGWTDSDTWEMGWYLANVIAGMAAFLREHGNGYPCIHYRERPCKCEEKWQHILMRIEYGFRFYNFVEEYDWKESLEVYMERSPERERVQVLAVQEALKLLRKYYGHLWD